MKNILLLTMMLCASTTFATVRTVSNQTPNPGQYTTIQAAINASSAGDTVYVHGSPTYYSAFNLSIQLTIIGTGFAPSSTNMANAYSIVQGGTCNLTGAASGTKIIGIYFSSVTIGLAINLHDIIITRCEFSGGSNSGIAILFGAGNYNMTVAENVFFEGSIYNGNANAQSQSFLITNNVFRVFNGSALREWNFVSNVIVSNNMFYGDGPNSIGYGYVYGVAFSNNIFNKVTFGALSACTFSNNLTYQCTSTTPWITNGTDVGVPALGTQNIAAISPDFVNQSSINAFSYWGSPSNFYNWYAVNPGSPTLSSMAGDPDMGPYGGSGSYNFNKASASTLPYVYNLSIGNPTIQSGTNLNINVIGKKHD